MSTEKTIKTDLWFLSGGGEMGQFIREKDWSKTSLGAPESWPRSLRTMVAVMLDNPFGMYIAWGNDYTQLYNDGYRPILGATKHPLALGISTRETFSEIWHIIESMFDGVMQGTAVGFPDLMLPLNRNGFIEDCYFDFAYSPIRKDDGEVGGVLVTVIETTAKKRATDALKESNARYINNIMQAPVAMCVFRGEHYVVEIVNSRMLELWGKQAEQVMNKPVFEGLPEAKDQGLEPLLDNVFKTGEKFVANERPVKLPRNGKVETTYINFVYEALKEADGRISGVVATAIEVTQQVTSRSRIEESEQKVRALVENAPFPIAVYNGKDMIVELANQSIIDIWGKGNDVIGKSFKDVLPELDNQLVFEQITSVLKNGESFHTKNTPLDLVVDGKSQTFYFNYGLTPLYDIGGNVYGVMNTGVDLTDLNIAKKQVEESDKRFRTTVKQAPVGITILRGERYIVEMANDAYLQLVDRTEEKFVGRPLFDSLPEVEESVHSLLDSVLNTGAPYHGNEVEIPVNRRGKHGVGYFDFLYYPLKEEDGKISGVIVTVTEVSEKVEARKKIEQNEERLNIVVDASELGTWELNLKTKEPKYSKRYLEIIGGYKEDITLTHEQLLQHLHPDDMHIRELAFKDAILKGYLHFEARLIWKDKSIHWIEVKGKVFYNKENNPEKLIGTVRDITDVKNHEQELDKLVKERTLQLERSNEDLQQFAHVASHDLKEPLRKIKIFTNRMKEEHADSLPVPVINFIDKITSASTRMQMMVDGVLSFSSVNSTEQPIQKIDLNRIFKNLKNDLEIVVEQKKAKIISDDLPTIEGGDILINQLFYNLLQNALKFSKENEAPVIEINSSIINETGGDHVKIFVKDNGIGFDQNRSEQIFETFVRLNSKDKYEGTGLGLSLCKKIVERHHGRIEAKSKKGEGTTFIITLPLKQMKTLI